MQAQIAGSWTRRPPPDDSSSVARTVEDIRYHKSGTRGGGLRHGASFVLHGHTRHRNTLVAFSSMPHFGPRFFHKSLSQSFRSNTHTWSEKLNPSASSTRHSEKQHAQISALPAHTSEVPKRCAFVCVCVGINWYLSVSFNDHKNVWK